MWGCHGFALKYACVISTIIIPREMQSHLCVDDPAAEFQLCGVSCNQVFWRWMLSELMIIPNIMTLMEVAPLWFDSSGWCSALPSSLEMKAAAKQGRLALSPLISLLFSLTDLWSYLDPKARHTRRVWSLLCSPQDLALVLFHVFTFSCLCFFLSVSFMQRGIF